MQTRLGIFYPPQRTVLVLKYQLITVPLGINDKVVMDCSFFAVFKRNDEIVTGAGKLRYFFRIDV
ncbi:hypothetical protein B5M10_16070 [Pluralibacter gergoviae]|nr:hypothetical protein [Pluralibacter gergoviae]AIR01125.1 hypothetical protein LG71_14990 [Pluralibacter gergoviae]KMK09699.1 hypothetical protein ABW07_04370 [Pluralibacter gergoviae]KMK28808.1 hypothetical protein ABW11_08370 [Pluralibacter gergoviae]KMK33337.1 hypothetical protein ABW12_04825 [Pluralibacter gergoviae]KMK42613.1 hypothetical protein ABW13_07395 [Pluralibacter gergoviae]